MFAAHDLFGDPTGGDTDDDGREKRDFVHGVTSSHGMNEK